MDFLETVKTERTQQEKYDQQLDDFLKELGKSDIPEVTSSFSPTPTVQSIPESPPAKSFRGKKGKTPVSISPSPPPITGVVDFGVPPPPPSISVPQQDLSHSTISILDSISRLIQKVELLEGSVKGVYELLEANLLPLLESLKVKLGVTPTLEERILMVLNSSRNKLPLASLLSVIPVPKEELFATLKSLIERGKVKTDQVSLWVE